MPLAASVAQAHGSGPKVLWPSKKLDWVIPIKIALARTGVTELCKPLVSLSVDVACSYFTVDVSCTEPMRPGTTARTRCKQHYRAQYSPEYSHLTCRSDGEWDYPLFHCVPGTSFIQVPLPPNVNVSQVNVYVFIVAPQYSYNYSVPYPSVPGS